MKLFFFPAMSSIVPRLSFKNNGFGIKYLTEVDMPLDRENEPIYQHFHNAQSDKKFT